MKKDFQQWHAVKQTAPDAHERRFYHEREVWWCVPLTTKQKIGRYYFSVDLNDGVERKAVLSQMRLLDTKRLVKKMGALSAPQFYMLKQALIRFLE